MKSIIQHLKVFRKDNTKDASRLPSHGIDSWKKDIGDRLRYSAAELRNHIAKAVEVECVTFAIVGSHKR